LNELTVDDLIDMTNADNHIKYSRELSRKETSEKNLNTIINEPSDYYISEAFAL
jgi:hypothetical protein